MRIDIGGGVRLFVDVDGLGLVPEGPAMVERPTVVLVHGGPGMDHTVFKSDPLTAPTDVAQVIWYDQRGHGRSDERPPEEWSLDTWADDIVRLCDALEVSKPIVIGASFGGFVVQRYLARHPEHPAKVVLACTSTRLDLDVIEAAFAKRGGPDVGAIARSFWESGEPMADYMTQCMPLYSASGGPPDLDRLLRGIMRMEILQHFQQGEQRTMDLGAGNARAQCPVLVIGGELDPITPIESNEELARSLPAGLVRFERVPGASHLEIAAMASSPLVVDFITS